MESTVQIIPLANLAIAFVPVISVVGLLYKWSLDAGTAFYSILRMLVQLIIIGYVLVFIFETEKLWVTALIVLVMVMAFSWIALRTLDDLRVSLFKYVFISSLFGGGNVILMSIAWVLDLDPIFKTSICGAAGRDGVCKFYEYHESCPGTLKF